MGQSWPDSGKEGTGPLSDCRKSLKSSPSADNLRPKSRALRPGWPPKRACGRSAPTTATPTGKFCGKLCARSCAPSARFAVKFCRRGFQRGKRAELASASRSVAPFAACRVSRHAEAGTAPCRAGLLSFFTPPGGFSGRSAQRLDGLADVGQLVPGGGLLGAHVLH